LSVAKCGVTCRSVSPGFRYAQSRLRSLLAESEDAAIKKIIADQIKVAMDKQGLSKTEMAARMKTSRRQLDRLLDPDNPSVTLATLRRAASAVGRNLRVELE
jgi:hypothetical protein